MKFRFYWKKGMWFYLALALVMLSLPGNKARLYAVVPAVLSWCCYLMRSCHLVLTEHKLIYRAEFGRMFQLNLNEITKIKFTAGTLEPIPFGGVWSIEVRTPSQSIRIPAQVVHQKQFLESLCFKTGLPQPEIPILFSGSKG